MESTVVVVGDIHGDLYAFETILEKIHHRFESRVFIVLVGDLVDGLTREIDTGCAYHRTLTAYAPGHDTYLFTSCAPCPDRSSRTAKIRMNAKCVSCV